MAPRTLLLLTCAGLVACGAAEPNEAESRTLAESRASWSALKASSGGAYEYTTGDSLEEARYRWTMTVEVRADHVVRRSFVRQPFDGDRPDVAESWEETGADVGRHDAGVPPLTIDQVYDRCATEVLSKDPAKNVIRLTTHPGGLLASCVYREKGCADDCDSGVRIDTLRFLE